MLIITFLSCLVKERVVDGPPQRPGQLAVVCDTMLQGLGKYLRCCGVDTVILQNGDDHMHAVEVGLLKEVRPSYHEDLSQGYHPKKFERGLYYRQILEATPLTTPMATTPILSIGLKIFCCVYEIIQTIQRPKN